MCKFAALMEEQNELTEIQKDKSRITSRSREAAQIRKREDVLKKNLIAYFPKVMACLKV